MPTKPTAKAGKPIHLNQQLCALRFTPNGKTLAAGTFEGSVCRWDAAMVEQDAMNGHNGWVQRIEFHPDGKRLFSADSWGRLIAWHILDKVPKPVWNIADAHDGWIYSMALSPDGKTLATGGRDGRIRLSDPETGKMLREIQVGEHVLSLIFAPDGKSLLSGDLKGNIRQWDLVANKSVRELDAKIMFLHDRIQDVGGVRCFTFTRDGKTLFAGGSQPKTGAFVQGFSLILGFDWQSGKSTTLHKGATDNDGYVYEMAWHPSGYLIAITSGQPGQGKLFFQLPGESQPAFTQPLPNPHSFAVSPDGKRIIVAATNANSAGNGRQIGKDKEYPGNFSVLHSFELAN